MAAKKGGGLAPQQCLPFSLKGNTLLFTCPVPSRRSGPPKACTHPRLLPAPQPRFLSHCQSTRAVIINGLSQCDSCGPLKIGLNNKILAYGNFFSSPAPPFSLPHFSLVTHANALPKYLPPWAGMVRGQTRFCLLANDLWELTLLGPSPGSGTGQNA